MTRSIKDLIGRYQSLEPSDRKIKRAIQQAVKSICAVELPVTHIQIQQKTAFLTLHPIEKKTMFQQGPLILKEVEKILGSPVITILK